MAAGIRASPFLCTALLTLAYFHAATAARGNDDFQPLIDSSDLTNSDTIMLMAASGEEDTTIAPTVRTTVTPTSLAAALTALVVSTTMSDSAIEAQLESQFSDVFTNYCANASVAASCNGYLDNSAAFALDRADTCVYNVSIIRSALNATSGRKTLTLVVAFVCNGVYSANSLMPSSLLAPFFTANKNSFTGVPIVMSYAVLSLLSFEFSTTSPSGGYDTVTYGEAYYVATIVLASVLGAVLLALLIGGIYCYLGKRNKESIEGNGSNKVSPDDVKEKTSSV